MGGLYDYKNNTKYYIMERDLESERGCEILQD